VNINTPILGDRRKWASEVYAPSFLDYGRISQQKKRGKYVKY
jgi:hypothetical protein